jgi:predicted nuclease of predicted toxin-antitoxin system
VIVWVDAQLSPTLAPWISERFGIEAFSVKYLGHRDASDREIFEAARSAGVVVMTKDIDFVRLLEKHGPPPQVLWVTLGNTSNRRMREVLEEVFSAAVSLLEAGEPLVEISVSG